MDNYTFCMPLGEGSSSSVSLYIENSSGALFAIKTVKRSKTSLIKREIKALEKLKGCQSIINLHEYIEDDENFHIILEYCKDGTLENYLATHPRIPHIHKISLIVDIVRGVYEMHSFKLIHRDLKSSNFVLNEGILKLADFGISKELSLSDMTICGTPFYMAPEMFESIRYDSKVDIWALGVISYEILTGRRPFIASNFEELIRIINQKVDFSEMGEDETEFLMMTLQAKPFHRSRIEEIAKTKLIQKYLKNIFHGLEKLLSYLELFLSNKAFLNARFAVICYLIKDVLYFRNKETLKSDLNEIAQQLGIKNIDKIIWNSILEESQSTLDYLAKRNVLMANLLMFALKRLKRFLVFEWINEYLV